MDRVTIAVSIVRSDRQTVESITTWGVPIGVAQEGLDVLGLFFANLTLKGGPAPVRAYMPRLMDAVLSGNLDPSPIFDMTVGLDGIPDGYKAIDSRKALKVLVKV